MLEVNIEKIIPVTEARDMFNKIVDDVEGTDELYVLTKNGKPAAVVVGVNHLEKLTGQSHGDVTAKLEEVEETVAGPVLQTPPDNMPEEEHQTVFASADDAVASTADSAAVPDPFAIAESQVAAENTGAVSIPTGQVAEASLNPTMPSTENTGQVDRINPVPQGFGSNFASTQAPSQMRAEDEDSTVAPDDNMSAPTLAQDPLASNTATPAQSPAQFAADDEDDAVGPILPPAQG